ncbi:type IV pilus twitching motility protein PilT [Vibrio sp.]|nr:type IV pilus twitching motility protein PilT [Vibrio sp.]
MGITLETLLTSAVKNNASDLHLSANCCPMVRIDGQLRKLEFPEISKDEVKTLLFSLLSVEQQERLDKEKDIDFACSFAGIGRFRVNCFTQVRGLSAVFRTISDSVPESSDLNIPDVVLSLASSSQGLLLVTGPTGSGKSTTLASLIDRINREQNKHIVTIEDPIEFTHKSHHCLVHQREIGSDAISFERALKAVLREDPDIIMIGELRDLQTMRLALTAAETGHLVLASLHTQSAARTVDRIVDVFPAEEQGRVKSQLADTLLGVISQRLLRLSGGGRIGCFETMVTTPAISNLIREGRTVQIESAIQSGRQMGMQTLSQAEEILRLSGIQLINDEMPS